MADKNRYPQIPSTVWWGVRGILQRSPKSEISERILGIELGVQQAAARQYVAELKAVSIISDEGRATELALKWRQDERYADAVSEMLAQVYPAELLQIAPPGSADRTKVTKWFEAEGLGSGTASNKAATYMLLSSATPNEAPAKSPAKSTGDKPKAERPARVKAATRSPPTAKASDKGGGSQTSHARVGAPDAFPLNLNVQIHISADAGTDQIETIFSAMRRYLYDAPSS